MYRLCELARRTAAFFINYFLGPYLAHLICPLRNPVHRSFNVPQRDIFVKPPPTTSSRQYIVNNKKLESSQIQPVGNAQIRMDTEYLKKKEMKEAEEEGINEKAAKRQRTMTKVMLKRIEMADKMRKMQIRNINQLYRYEVADIRLRCERELQDAAEPPRPKHTSKRKNSEKHVERHVDRVLAERQIREDVKKITLDAITRSTSFYTNCGDVTKQSDVAVTLHKDGGVTIGDDRFTVGDMVEVQLHLCGESICAIVESISNVNLSLACGTGEELRINWDMIRTRRVTMAHDEESEENLDLISMARRLSPH